MATRAGSAEEGRRELGREEREDDPAPAEEEEALRVELGPSVEWSLRAGEVAAV